MCMRDRPILATREIGLLSVVVGRPEMILVVTAHIFNYTKYARSVTVLSTLMTAIGHARRRAHHRSRRVPASAEYQLQPASATWDAHSAPPELKTA
jgi:hypothetical protein